MANRPRHRYGAGITVRVSWPCHAYLKERAEKTGLSLTQLTLRVMREGLRAEGLSEDQLRELDML